MERANKNMISHNPSDLKILYFFETILYSSSLIVVNNAFKTKLYHCNETSFPKRHFFRVNNFLSKHWKNEISKLFSFNNLYISGLVPTYIRKIFLRFQSLFLYQIISPTWNFPSSSKSLKFHRHKLSMIFFPTLTVPLHLGTVLCIT